MLNIETIVLIPVFILLLVVISKVVSEMFDFGTFTSCALPISISMLCVIGMSPSLKGVTSTILLPYAALGITLLLLMLLMFMWKVLKNVRGYFSEYFKKIGMLADGVNNFFRPSYRKKYKMIAKYQRNNLKEIKPK